MGQEWTAAGIDKGTGRIKAVTQCGEDKEYALHIAEYYRKIGYSGKCLPYEEFCKMLDKEREEMYRGYSYNVYRE